MVVRKVLGAANGDGLGPYTYAEAHPAQVRARAQLEELGPNALGCNTDLALGYVWLGRPNNTR